MKKLLIALTLIMSSQVHSATITCTEINVQEVRVEGTRDDNHFFSNKLVIELDQSCGGKKHAHAALDHPAFDGFLSIILAAKASGSEVIISINTDNLPQISNQIAWVGIE